MIESGPILGTVPEEKPAPLHFEKKLWNPISIIKRYWATNRHLLRDNKRLTDEHSDWLGRMQQMNEAQQQLLKLNRVQVEELKTALDRACVAEEQLKSANEEIRLTKKGVTTHNGEIKALSIVQVTAGDDKTKPTYSPLILTLNSQATEITNREMLPNTNWDFAFDQSKIKFMELWDNQEMN